MQSSHINQVSIGAPLDPKNHSILFSLGVFLQKHKVL